MCVHLDTAEHRTLFVQIVLRRTFWCFVNSNERCRNRRSSRPHTQERIWVVHATYGMCTDWDCNVRFMLSKQQRKENTQRQWKVTSFEYIKMIRTQNLTFVSVTRTQIQSAVSFFTQGSFILKTCLNCTRFHIRGSPADGTRWIGRSRRP